MHITFVLFDKLGDINVESVQACQILTWHLVKFLFLLSVSSVLVFVYQQLFLLRKRPSVRTMTLKMSLAAPPSSPLWNVIKTFLLLEAFCFQR